MAMQQCPNGHLYDDEKNNSCPYCSGNSDVNVTMPLDAPNPVEIFPQTTPIEAQSQYTPQQVIQNSVPPTVPVGPQFAATTYKEDAVNDKGIAEVRGWLICLEGSKRGMDFKIHAEKNSIGRGPENDINLDFDSSISKGVNAIITYDNRNNKFYLYQSISKNNIYFNNQLLLTPVELKDYDVLEIGETKMIFRSLCNDDFKWEKTKKEE